MARPQQNWGLLTLLTRWASIWTMPNTASPKSEPPCGRAVYTPVRATILGHPPQKTAPGGIGPISPNISPNTSYQSYKPQVILMEVMFDVDEDPVMPILALTTPVVWALCWPYVRSNRPMSNAIPHCPFQFVWPMSDLFLIRLLPWDWFLREWCRIS